MATASMPVEVAINLIASLDPGEDPVNRTFTAALSVKPYSAFRHDLTGSGSKAIDMPSNPQLVLVLYESGTQAIELDLGTDVVTLKPGGAFLVVNPQAATSLPLTINYTSAAVIRGIVYG